MYSGVIGWSFYTGLQVYLIIDYIFTFKVMQFSPHGLKYHFYVYNSKIHILQLGLYLVYITSLLTCLYWLVTTFFQLHV